MNIIMIYIFINSNCYIQTRNAQAKVKLVGYNKRLKNIFA